MQQSLQGIFFTLDFAFILNYFVFCLQASNDFWDENLFCSKVGIANTFTKPSRVWLSLLVMFIKGLGKILRYHYDTVPKKQSWMVQSGPSNWLMHFKKIKINK